MSQNNIYNIFFLTIIWGMTCSANAFGQKAFETQENPNVVQSSRASGELNSLYVDLVGSEAVQSKERVFVIFRAGDGEGPRTNGRRFNVIRKFLQKGKGYESLNVVYALGEKVKGEGRIEFYIGSKLRLITLAKRGKMPTMDCCF